MWLRTSLVVLILSSFTSAANEFSFSAAYSTDQLRGLRLGYRVTHLPIDMPDWLGSPAVHLEGAINHWQDSNNTLDNITALTLSPVFAWKLAGTKRPLYLEAGIGGSYFEETELGDRQLSTHFQFEDRIALAWQYSETSHARIRFGYSHYSNADIKQPNDGLDYYWLSWDFPF